MEASVLELRLPLPLSRAVAFASVGRILVCGGLEASGATSAAILRVDLAAGTATSIGRLASAVHDAAGAALPAGDLVFGGGVAAAVATIQRCDPSAVGPIGSLPEARADLSAVVVAGSTALIVGGGTTSTLPRAVLETTDGARLRAIGNLVDGVRYAAVVAVGQTVLVIGGYRAGAEVSEIQALDLVTGTSRILGHLPLPLDRASAAVLGSTILVAGGRSKGVAQAAIWQIEPSSGVVTRVGTLPAPLSDAAAVVLGDVAYLVGGEDSAGQVDTIVQVTGG